MVRTVALAKVKLEQGKLYLKHNCMIFQTSPVFHSVINNELHMRLAFNTELNKDQEII